MYELGYLNFKLFRPKKRPITLWFVLVDKEVVRSRTSRMKEQRKDQLHNSTRVGRPGQRLPECGYS